MNLVKWAIKSFIHSLTSRAGFVRLKHSSALNYLHQHQHVNTLKMSALTCWRIVRWMVSVYFFKPLLDRLTVNQAEREGQTCSRGPQVGLKPRPTTLWPYSIWLSAHPLIWTSLCISLTCWYVLEKVKKSKVIPKVITF